mgnify:CR=1 FL=1
MAGEDKEEVGALFGQLVNDTYVSLNAAEKMPAGTTIAVDLGIEFDRVTIARSGRTWRFWRKPASTETGLSIKFATRLTITKDLDQD